MNKTIVGTSALLGMLAVIFGALGAHSLKTWLTPEALNSFRTGVEYQMYHALFLLYISESKLLTKRFKKEIFTVILTGVFCFSGSIYLLTTSEITGINFKPFAWITPIGGVFLILGWALLGFRVFALKKKE
jgi:uncharacterized membrane protein YgdD (TMEM256/DUF423 family)